MQTTTTRADSAARPNAYPSPDAASPSWMRRTGRIVMVLLALFLLFDGAARAVGFAPYAEGTIQAGYPASLGLPIGLILITSTILYLIPRTAILGAILLTGYLGAATATNLRLEHPVVFPVLCGVLVWGALYLLDSRLREFIPFRR